MNPQEVTAIAFLAGLAFGSALSWLASMAFAFLRRKL